jgi:hypothetical protein
LPVLRLRDGLSFRIKARGTCAACYAIAVLSLEMLFEELNDGIAPLSAGLGARQFQRGRPTSIALLACATGRV